MDRLGAIALPALMVPAVFAAPGVPAVLADAAVVGVVPVVVVLVQVLYS
ncbi:MAG: hypothetical protein ACYCPO_07430 [Acidobacteriaceae bacterium]